MPKRKKPRWLTHGRREAIETYREPYRNLPTLEAWQDMLKNVILPAVCNYMEESEGAEAPKGEEHLDFTKKFAKYIVNNWRPRRDYGGPNSRLKFTLRDVVQWTMSAEIKAALRDILQDETLNSSPNAAFEQHNKALSQVMNGLSVMKHNELRAVALEWSHQGNPAEDQALLAQKYSGDRLRDSDLQHYKEMGMVCITFAAWRAVDGKVTVRLHDNIAENLQKNRTRFIEEQLNLCKTVTAELHKYVSSLLDVGVEESPNPYSVDPHQPDLQLKFDDDGFPILPEPISDDDNDIYQKKTELEDLARLFLRTHYCLTSGSKGSKPPYKEISHRNSTFIENEMLPDGITLKGLRSLKKKALQTVLSHWWDCQNALGHQNSFRWKCYMNLNAEIVPAEYGRRRDIEEKDARTKRQRKRRAEKKAAKDAEDTAEIGITSGTMDGTNPAHTPEINASVQADTAEALGTSVCPSMIIVDFETMGRLHDVGIPMPIPCGISREGHPFYLVKQTHVDHLHNLRVPTGSSGLNNTQLPPPAEGVVMTVPTPHSQDLLPPIAEASRPLPRQLHQTPSFPTNTLTTSSLSRCTSPLTEPCSPETIPVELPHLDKSLQVANIPNNMKRNLKRKASQIWDGLAGSSSVKNTSKAPRIRKRTGAGVIMEAPRRSERLSDVTPASLPKKRQRVDSKAKEKVKKKRK